MRRRVSQVRGARPVPVVLVAAVIALAACSSNDPAVDAVVEDLEQALSSDVVPALSRQGVTDATWETFRAAIRDVRTDDLHVIASGASGGEGGGEAATIESVVTIVGPEGGACIAVSVSADGTVKAIRVNGDPVENCVGAQVPQSLP